MGAGVHQLNSPSAFLTVDDLPEAAWDEVKKARERGLRADDVLSQGGFFGEALLTPTPFYGQSPSPKTAARVIADLRALRVAIKGCSEETLALFTDPIAPGEFLKSLKGEDFVSPPSLLDRLEFAEGLYPSDTAPLSAGDKALVASIQGRPLKYSLLEPTFVLLRLWKAKHPVVIGGKRSQTRGPGADRYRFTPMIEFVGDALLMIDKNLGTVEDDRPTSEDDPVSRRTSIENARITAWSCSTQLRSMVHFENSPGVRKLFEIDG